MSVEAIVEALKTFALPIASGTAGGAIFGPYISEYLKQHYQLKGLYLVPYREWCIRTHGYLHEFTEICDKVRENENNFILWNKNYIIHHVWIMHTQAEEAYRWLGKLRIERPEAYVLYNDLMDHVDRLWHFLEEHHYAISGPRGNSAEITQVLDRMSDDQKELVVYDIKLELDRPLYNTKMIKSELLTYFEDQIPGKKKKKRKLLL
jgi:hypothetical protein